MSDYNREAKATTRLSKLSVMISSASGAQLLAFLTFLYVTVNFEVQQSRTDISLLEEKTCLIVTHRKAAIKICDYGIHITNSKVSRFDPDN